MKLAEEEQSLRDKILLEGVETCMRMPKGEGNDEDIKQCAVCFGDCYLSAVFCTCKANEVACLRHAKKISFYIISLFFFKKNNFF